MGGRGCLGDAPGAQHKPQSQSPPAQTTVPEPRLLFPSSSSRWLTNSEHRSITSVVSGVEGSSLLCGNHTAPPPVKAKQCPLDPLPLSQNQVSPGHPNSVPAQASEVFASPWPLPGNRLWSLSWETHSVFIGQLFSFHRTNRPFLGLTISKLKVVPFKVNSK